MKKLCLLIIVSLIILLFSHIPSFSQDEPCDIDLAKIAAAIDKGRSFLLNHMGKGAVSLPRIMQGSHADELILYTLARIGVDPDHKGFRKLLTKVFDNKVYTTYNVAILAMALEALDKRKYQSLIAQCGQALIDSQRSSGQWGYGVPQIEMPKGRVRTALFKTEPNRILQPKRIRLNRRVKPNPRLFDRDNSNTVYALLGLRACMEANVIIPSSTFQAAEKWFLETQHKDGGWSYTTEFGSHGKQVKPSYGSMTTDGLISLVICEHYLKRPYKKHKSIRKAFRWLDKNFTIMENPKSPFPAYRYYYYYLGGLERVGMLYGTKSFGSHKWYALGAKHLLKIQESDGSWRTREGWRDQFSSLPVAVQTSFALLFLDRATKPIKVELDDILTALRQYKKAHGMWPTTAQGLNILVENDHLYEYPEDPWDNPYQYRYPSKYGLDFDLWAAGHDRRDGTEDDITNWEKPAKNHR